MLLPIATSYVFIHAAITFAPPLTENFDPSCKAEFAKVMLYELRRTVLAAPGALELWIKTSVTLFRE